MKAGAILLTLIALVSCGAKTTEGGGNGTDSNTHWLGRCMVDDDCERGLSCVCGACTRECRSPTRCASLDERALCLDVQCEDDGAVGICSLGCSAERDCPAGTNCEGGACVPRRATPLPTPPTTQPPATRRDAGAEAPGAPSAPDGSVSGAPDPSPSEGRCPAQDATSSGALCPAIAGYAFDGTRCAAVLCDCTGEDCDEVFASQGLCELSFAECIQSLRTCADSVFPLLAEGAFWSPAVAEFSFEVVVLPPGAENGTDAFVDWTPARWLEGHDLTDERSPCPGPGAGETPTLCPYPRELSLSVDDEPVSVLAVANWEQVRLPPAQTEVEVRIEHHPRGTASFQVREPETGLPLLLIVQRADALELEASWHLPPFTFSPGAAVCDASSVACEGRFLAQALHVEVEGSETPSRIDPLQVGILAQTGSGTPTYQVSHSGLFVPVFDGEDCDAPRPWQSFAVSKVGD